MSQVLPKLVGITGQSVAIPDIYELEGSEIEENFGFKSGTETTVLVDCQFDERETYREAETPPNPGRH